MMGVFYCLVVHLYIMPLRLYIYFIAISFLASLLVYNKKKTPLYLNLFPPYLFLTLTAETWGTYLWSMGKNNLLLYNLFTTFEFCFYFWVISEMIKSKKIKKVVLLTIPFYILCVVINFIWGQTLASFHTITYSLGCLLIVIFCIYYFLELFRLPKSVKLQKDPSFWICAGLLFFYCCGFPLYGLINYWSEISILVVLNFDKIFTLLNIFLYTLFTIAFLCTRTEKYTSLPS